MAEAEGGPSSTSNLKTKSKLGEELGGTRHPVSNYLCDLNIFFGIVLLFYQDKHALRSKPMTARQERFNRNLQELPRPFSSRSKFWDCLYLWLIF